MVVGEDRVRLALQREGFGEVGHCRRIFTQQTQQQVLASKLNVHACVHIKLCSFRPMYSKKEVVKRMGERRLLRKRKANVPPQQTFRTFPRFFFSYQTSLKTFTHSATASCSSHLCDVWTPHGMLGVTVCVRYCDMAGDAHTSCS